MFVNLVLSCVSGVFVLMSVMKDLPDTLPIGCVWYVEDTNAAGNAGVSVAGTIAVMAGQVIFFSLSVWYLHVREKGWLKIVQISGILVLFAIGAGAAIRVILLSQAFGTPSVELRDQGEKEWSFGQLVGLGLLLLPIIGMIEMSRGMCVLEGFIYHTDKKQESCRSRRQSKMPMIRFHSPMTSRRERFVTLSSRTLSTG